MSVGSVYATLETMGDEEVAEAMTLLCNPQDKAPLRSVAKRLEELTPNRIANAMRHMDSQNSTGWLKMMAPTEAAGVLKAMSRNQDIGVAVDLLVTLPAWKQAEP